MKYKWLNDNKVTVQLKLSVGTLGKSRKEGRDLSDKVIELILNFYNDLGRVWLLTGEGSMLKNSAPQPTAAQEDAGCIFRTCNSIKPGQAYIRHAFKKPYGVLAKAMLTRL